MRLTLQQIPISVLDVIPVLEGETFTQAFERTRNLAIHLDQLGFQRYWFAEHHNANGVASSFPPIVIGHMAEATKRIRIGSGGIMLSNHAPYSVAEQFATLNAMYPGRIDLGLGRAPGTDPFTARALRRNTTGDDFELALYELNGYLREYKDIDSIRAFPAGDTSMPIWLLGSSMFSAELAAKLGYPYAFASHFAPDYLLHALKTYAANFKPSKYLEKPYMMASANVILADTDEEAHYLATSFYQYFLGIVRRERMQFKRPVESMDNIWSHFERQSVEQALYYTFVGSKETVQQKLEHFVETTGIHELIVSSYIFDEEKRHHSFSLLKEIATSQY